MEGTDARRDVMTIDGERWVRESSIPHAASSAPEELYTARQVAQMAHVSVRTVYTAMERGTLPFVVPNGCERPRLVRRSAYERWVGLAT